jgi:signal transduction histidine kinase
MASMTDPTSPTSAALARVASVIAQSGIGSITSTEVIERARRRALELAEASAGDDASALAILMFASDVLCAAVVDLAAHPESATRLLERIEHSTGVSRVALAREVVRAAQLPQLSTDVAIEVQLTLLRTFSRVRAVSLWTLWPNGELRPVAHAGDLDPGAAPVRETATSFLSEAAADIDADNPVVGTTLDRWRLPPAAVIAHGSPRGADHRKLLLEAATPVLGSMLERDELLARELAPEQSVLASVERRLARLRFDLHDGPQQDVHLLAMDLNLFREQLVPRIADDPNRDRLVGRLDDLAAQLVALDGDLRRLATSVRSPFLQPGSLADALRQITDAFSTRTAIVPQTELRGDFNALTDSQQITLLALIREALSNVHKHSGATVVTIAIASDPQCLHARITDDGQGFEPETTLVRAAREGHLGLVGMHERVRMLGGETRIDSRPGGPTVISATLPSWPEPAAADDEE